MTVQLGLNKKRAVILGAAGFIGVHLVRLLMRQGWSVVCFDRHISPFWPPGVEVICGDFRNIPDALDAALDNVYVFHLVSSSQMSSPRAGLAQQITNDVSATLRLLGLTRRRNLRWVFLSSGGSVFGEQAHLPISETSTPNPISVYGTIKRAVEACYELDRYRYGTNYVTVRLANPFGPFQKPHLGQGIVATLLGNTHQGEPTTIWGDGAHIRDYIFIDDAVSGIVCAATKGEEGHIYNVGSGTGTSVIELISMVRRITGSNVRTKYAPARSLDVRVNVLSSQKLNLLCGWQPLIPLFEGLKLTDHWIRGFLLNESFLRTAPFCANE